MNFIQKYVKNIYQNKSIYFLLKIIIFALVFFLISIRIWLNLFSHYINIDELIFIDRGNYLILYLDRDFQNEKWRDFNSYDVPKFGEYFYGIVISMYSRKIPQDFLYKIGFYDFEWLDIFHSFNNLGDNLRWHEAIKISRIAVFFAFIIPTLLVVFLIGKLSHNYLFGIILIFILSKQEIFVNSMSRAMGDAPLWLFSFLTLLISFKYITKEEKNFYPITSILGLVIGLAISTKYNGVINLFYISVFFLILVAKKIITLKFSITNLFLIFVISIFSLIILNPITWHNPATIWMEISNHRFETFKSQQTTIPSEALTTIPQRLMSIKNIVFPEILLESTLFLATLFILFLFKKLHLKLKFSASKNIYNPNHNFLKMATYLWILSWVLISALLVPLNWERYYMPFIILDSFLKAEYIFMIIKINDLFRFESKLK